jgi:hypothetical protein
LEDEKEELETSYEEALEKIQQLEDDLEECQDE